MRVERAGSADARCSEGLRGTSRCCCCRHSSRCASASVAALGASLLFFPSRSTSLRSLSFGPSRVLPLSTSLQRWRVSIEMSFGGCDLAHLRVNQRRKGLKGRRKGRTERDELLSDTMGALLSGWSPLSLSLSVSITQSRTQTSKHTAEELIITHAARWLGEQCSGWLVGWLVACLVGWLALWCSFGV